MSRNDHAHDCDVLDVLDVLHIVRVVDDLDVLLDVETELIDQVANVDQLMDLDLVVLDNLVHEQLDIALDPIVIVHHGLLDAIEMNIRMDTNTADTIVLVDGDSTLGRHCSKREMARSIDQRTKVDNRHTVVDDELLEAFDIEAIWLLELNQVDNELEANVLEPNGQVLDNASDDVDVIVVDLVDVVGLIVDVRAMSIVIVMVSLGSSIVVVVVVSWKIILKSSTGRALVLSFVDGRIVRRCCGGRQLV